MDGIFLRIKNCSGNFGLFGLFSTSEFFGGYLPKNFPTLQGTLLRIFEDKTAEGNAGLDGLHLPALVPSHWWKAVLLISNCIMSSWLV